MFSAGCWIICGFCGYSLRTQGSYEPPIAGRGKQRGCSQTKFTVTVRKLRSLKNKAALTLKNFMYGRRGEPYVVAGRTLRYLPGTRPTRIRYASARDDNTRYDALQVCLFANQLSEGDTAIDIGAHAGQYCIMMAAMCGYTGHVVAFEPDPYARRRLIHNLKLNPSIKPPAVEQYAVSDRSGAGTLFSRGGNSQSSLVRSGVEFSATEHAEPITVRLISLDEYMLRSGLPQPRWVKIDAEGAEIRILAGARRLLASSAGIVCELHPYAWADFGNDFDELKRLAHLSGRRIRYLDQDVSYIGDTAIYGTVVLERNA